MAKSRKSGLKSRHKTYHKLLRPEALTAAATGPWNVPDLCAAYSWPNNLAGGGVIAIVELAGGWTQTDMDSFFKSLGQPPPQITDISVDETKNNPNQGVGASFDPDIEVTLNIQIAAASYYAATGKPADIRVYWSKDIASAVQKAADDGCDVCSISWGGDEAIWGAAAVQAMEAVAEASTRAGMTIFAATGDNDAGDGGPTPANVDAPSSCPHIVACGGTNKTATTEKVWNETPGNSNGQGTGGGYSTVFPPQNFQKGAPPAPARATFGTGRMIPDVCADADPMTGYRVFLHRAPAVVGGTSAAAPLYAGLFASFGKKLGFVTPTLWDNQDAFNDITDGDNGMYLAKPGPDPCSGIGSPIGTKIAALFVGKS